MPSGLVSMLPCRRQLTDPRLAFVLRFPKVTTGEEIVMSETEAMKDKAQGKLREAKGTITGDTAEKMKGKLQETKGDVEHEVEKVRREEVKEESRDKARHEFDRRTP